jgi:hypothetical protein
MRCPACNHVVTVSSRHAGLYTVCDDWCCSACQSAGHRSERLPIGWTIAEALSFPWVVVYRVLKREDYDKKLKNGRRRAAAANRQPVVASRDDDPGGAEKS